MASTDAYILQGVSQEIHIHNMQGMPDSEHAPRICGCHSYRKPGASVTLHRSPDNQVFYSGLQTCGSVWACPVCAGKITQGRADEIRQAIDLWAVREPDGFTAMLTLTIPHTADQPFLTVRTRLKNGLRDMKRAISKSRPTWRDLDIRHTITSIEPVLGSNGWHIHFHILLFFAVQVDLDEVRRVILNEWIHYAGAGLTAKQKADMYLHSVDLVRCKSWNDYLAKLALQKASDDEIKACRAAFSMSWQVNHEIAFSHVKRGRAASLSPFDILRLLADLSPYSPDYKAIKKFYSEKFWEYAKAQKGQRYVYFSKGFKALLGLAEKTDDEILAETDESEMEKSTVIAVIEPQVWHEILANGWRGELLRKIESGLNFDQAMIELRATVFRPRKPITHKKRRVAA